MGKVRASPTIAQLVKQAGALTVVVVTKPFEFKGERGWVALRSQDKD